MKPGIAMVVVVAVLLVGCASGAVATPHVIYVTPEPTEVPAELRATPVPATLAPTAATPTLAPTPKPTAAPAQPTVTPTDSITRAQANAIRAAQDYLDYSAFSRSGLIGQLEYEGYSTADATFAVNSLDVDWNEQAYLSAKSYLDYSSFSLSGLIGQLEYEGFSHAEATYGAKKAYK